MREEIVNRAVYMECRSVCEDLTKSLLKSMRFTLIFFAQNLWLRCMTKNGEGPGKSRTRSTPSRNRAIFMLASHANRLVSLMNPMQRLMGCWENS